MNLNRHASRHSSVELHKVEVVFKIIIIIIIIIIISREDFKIQRPYNRNTAHVEC
jgi:hypothetical protein